MGVPCRTALAVVGLLAVAEPVVLSAQYFGRNKVEYVDFDFQILATEHFDVYYYQREEHAARLAAQLAERWYARFSRVLNHQLISRQPLVLYGSQPEFAQTNVVAGILSDTVGGVTEASKRRIVMPFAPTLAETNRVLGHEIAHAFQFSIGRRHGGSMGLPLWFIEGMAEYLARGATDAEATLWIRDAVWTERLPPRARDAAVTLSPYHYGHAFWAYLAGRFGDEVLERALKPPNKRGTMDDRMRAATGSSLDELYADFRTAVAKQYADKPGDPEDMPKPRSLASPAAGRVQLSPALSPDGKFAVFFSERDRLSLDLFLVDVTTGHIVRKLATTTASARFDSLQPLRAAGAWSPNGDAFAFPAVRQGHGALIVFDMRRPGHDREIPFADLAQILSATWAPDGRRLALSALAGGLTNLYVYDLGAATLRQLTDDPYTDLQPAWSPDGQKIAFATDRYSTDLNVLAFGPTTLAVIDVASAAVSQVSAVPSGRSYINPQWTTDGRALYCVANFGQGSNVFRVDLDSGAHYQLTDVKTGVTGLTPTSPALSVAANAATAAFTVYGNRSYAVTVLDGDLALAGQPVVEVNADASPDNDGEASSSTSGVVSEVLADNLTGLPVTDTMRVRDYTPRLALERIGQPYVSSGGGAFGTFVRGGGSFLFGDMLGERRLGAAVQIANRMRDAAFEVRYLNQSRRWNWGAIAELEPALRRYRSTAAIDHEGEPALLRQADYLERTQLYGAGLLAYPFSRGLRLEVIGGVRHASYHRDLRSQISSVETGRVLEQLHEQSSGGVPTTVAEIGGAVVGDTTVFGPTGPLLGSRFRFEVAPATGDLTYTRVLADYRRYLMPVRPYTVALRVLHSARYGHDGDDPRLLPSFLGSRYLVRGHSTDARDCQPDPGRVCGAELLGSRLVVGNVELRAPVWGLLKHKLEYGPLPLDAFLFADSGVVWSRRPQDAVDVGRRTMINSLGMGVRLNVGGLPFEIAAVRALDGPSPGWSYDFGFRTGF
jgi:hypothetical protein